MGRIKQEEKKNRTVKSKRKAAAEQLWHLIHHRYLSLQKQMKRLKDCCKHKKSMIDTKKMESDIVLLERKLVEAKRIESVAEKSLTSNVSWNKLVGDKKLRRKDFAYWKKSLLYYIDTAFYKHCGLYVEEAGNCMTKEGEDVYIVRYFEDYQPYWFIGRLASIDEKDNTKGWNVIYEDGQVQFFSETAIKKFIVSEVVLLRWFPLCRIEKADGAHFKRGKEVKLDDVLFV